MMTGVDVFIEPTEGGERKFQFETLEDGMVVCTLLWHDPIRDKWVEVDHMAALPPGLVGSR